VHTGFCSDVHVIESSQHRVSTYAVSKSSIHRCFAEKLLLNRLNYSHWRLELLEGKVVNLRVMEKEDLPLLAEWHNNPDFLGENFPPIQKSRTEREKMLEPNPFESRAFIIEKKNCNKIGYIVHFYMLHPYGKNAGIRLMLLFQVREAKTPAQKLQRQCWITCLYVFSSRN